MIPGEHSRTVIDLNSSDRSEPAPVFLSGFASEENLSSMLGYVKVQVMLSKGRVNLEASFQNSRHTHIQAGPKIPSLALEGSSFCAQNGVWYSERGRLQNELKEVPRRPVSSGNVTREIAVLFKSIIPPETGPRQRRPPSVDSPANNSQPNARLRRWNAFKGALENQAVQLGYLGSAGSILAMGQLVERGWSELMLAGPISLLGCTIFNHLREAHSLLKEEHQRPLNGTHQ